MPHMSQGDALVLAGSYATYAEDLVEYQADHGDDDDVDQAQLSTMVSALTQHSRTLANDALATSFNDAGAATQQLQKVTADAASALAELQAEVKQYSRIAAITAGVINIGVGLALNNPEAAIKAAVGLAGTLSKS